MVWPPGKRVAGAERRLPEGYALRTYRPGDEARFFRLMQAAGWPSWDEEKLHPWLYRILPGGWYFAVHTASDEIAATCMATHDPTWQVPFCGEVGWTAAHPAHRGKGLGPAVVSAVVARFLDAGYPCIHLYTEHWRDAALKMYLSLGFVPYLDPPETARLWEAICARINWAFKPDAWVTNLAEWAKF